MIFPNIGNYKVVRKICKKLCFTLYEAVDEINEKRRFLKVLDESFHSDGICVYHFLNGARLSSLLDSEHVCKIYQYGKVNDHYIIVSEPVDSKPLSLFIHEAFPISLPKIVEVVSKISNTLRHAHLHGVIHGLLNPCSIFVADNSSVKIDDFCYYWIPPYLPKIEDAEALYLSYHISPECYQGIGEIDGRADIYSLGVILLQFLTDYIPFDGENPKTNKNRRLPISISSLHKLLSDYPKRLERILVKTMNKNPEHRFWNLREFMDELRLLKFETLSFSKARSRAAKKSIVRKKSK
ncbi:MAG: serine/threonine protein kinase [bacterium]